MDGLEACLMRYIRLPADSQTEPASMDTTIMTQHIPYPVPPIRIRRWVPPAETRREYVPVVSSKTSMFLEVSEGGTHPLLLWCASLRGMRVCHSVKLWYSGLQLLRFGPNTPVVLLRCYHQLFFQAGPLQRVNLWI